jgi:hypothetical protein
MNNINQSIATNMLYKEPAKEIWDTLKKMYSQKTSSSHLADIY